MIFGITGIPIPRPDDGFTRGSGCGPPLGQGLVSPPREPDLHWAWPVGIDQVARVRTDEVHRLSIGRAEVAGPSDDPGVGEFLTGDLNLLHACGVVQYCVADPTAFLL